MNDGMPLLSSSPVPNFDLSAKSVGALAGKCISFPRIPFATINGLKGAVPKPLSDIGVMNSIFMFIVLGAL